MPALHVEIAVIGRDKEIARIDGWLAAANDPGRVLLIEGEPGAGKTTVWRDAIRRADAMGMKVLHCQPGESELKLAYSGLSDMLDSIPATEIGRLPAPQRDALDSALLRTGKPESALDPRTVATASLSLLRLLASERRVLVAVDDLQWLDAPSAQALAFVARRLDDRMAVLATTRAPGQTLAALGEDRVVRLSIGPLSLAALHRVLQTRLGRSFPRLVLVKIHRASRGNPLHALEIGRALVSSGARVSPGAALPVHESLDRLLIDRILALPARTRDALCFAALAADLTLDTLSRAGFDDPLVALEPGVREEIVTLAGGGVRFTHPLIAAAVVAGMGTRKVRDIHALLAQQADSIETSAWHAGLAAEGPDQRVADDLATAAALARRRGAPIAAGELLELARSVMPGEHAETAGELTFQAAENYFEAGELERAASLLRELASTGAQDRPRARALQLLSQVSTKTFSFVEARAYAQEALDTAGDDPALRAAILLDRALADFCLGDLGSAAETTANAVTEATRAGIPALRAQALASRTITRFFLGLGIDEAPLAEALALEDPGWPGPLEMRASFVRALFHLWTHQLDGALEVMGALRAEAIDRGQDIRLPVLDFYLTLAALWKGDIARASLYVEECGESAALNDEPVGRALALSARALLDTYGGSPEQVRAAAGEADAIFQRTNFNIYMTWPLLAIAQVELALGNARQVDEILRGMADGLTSMEVGDPILGVFLPDEIEAVVSLGDLDRAGGYTDWLESRGRQVDRPWAKAAAAYCRGLIAAARGELEAALEAVDSAIAQAPLPLDRARALLLKGLLQRRRREKRRALESLQEAQGIFDMLGAVRWSARTASEIARVGLRRNPQALSETERRVAELAASGLTNRQVAEAAFISAKTVEANLARVYAKLGIRSRTQLARALRDSEKPA
ncbi:MAG: AAA family ATPase [Candidatus Dormiibacterota bacterium]